MKRLFIIFIATVLLAGFMAGCSASTSNTPYPISPASSAAGSYAPIPAPYASAAPASSGAYASAAPAASAAASAKTPAGYAPPAIAQAATPGNCIPYPTPAPGGYNAEEYDTVKENPFTSVTVAPVSTFSADVDTASYCNVRRMIESGYTPGSIPNGAVRTEEMLNYFSFDYNRPAPGQPFGLTASVSACPWNRADQLLVLGITTRDIDYAEIGGCNYVFLIDTSGSMDSQDKLGLVKASLLKLLDNLHDRDRISIVTYAGASSVLAQGVYGDDRTQLSRIIKSLGAGGSTNGSAGILDAYRLAEKFFIRGGVNRIIMCSDGDLNVGITSQSDLYDLVSDKRKSGVYLSVLGFGTGNYSDSRMQTLADNGNGNYYYIDSIGEADKVLSRDLVSTLVTVAKDVKFQIEFNPGYVQSYRQLGYENRQLNAQDFKNDKVDAGEIGSGCCLTVVYELVPAGSDSAGGTDLRYQTSSLTEAAQTGEWMTVAVRYKLPDENKSNLLEYTIGNGNLTDRPSKDWRFAAAVCEFAMLLNDSRYKGTTSFGSVVDLLKTNDLWADPDKAEFSGLVQKVAWAR